MLFTNLHHYYAYVVNYLSSIPPSSYVAFATFLGSSAAVSVVVQYIKHRYSLKREKEMAKSAIAFVLGALSFLFTFADYIVNQTNLHPNFLGSRTLQVAGAAYFIYHFGASKGYTKVATVLSKWGKIANEYNAETTAQPTVEPPTPPSSDLLL